MFTNKWKLLLACLAGFLLPGVACTTAYTPGETAAHIDSFAVASLDGPALLDGGETGLSAPGIAIADGTGIVIAGVGTDGGSGAFSINVPGTVKQALLYWAGEHRLGTQDGSIDADFDGNLQSLNGTLIGGPTFFFNFGGQVYVSTFRADVTAFVQSGMNNVSISGMDFDVQNLGAGLLVIYDDGTAGEIAIRDGQDLAYAFFAPPLNATVPQTLAFAPTGSARTANLHIFASDVGAGRPNQIRIEVDGQAPVTLDNPLGSLSGEQWDALTLPVAIPAGAASVTVEVISWDDPSDVLPASLGWQVGALDIALPYCGDGNVDPGEECDDGNNDPNDGCSPDCTIELVGEGCTPGYWKQEQHFDSWVGYTPNQLFDAVFGVDAPGDKTLLETMWTGGGGAHALGRHAVAALLNAASSVDYAYTEAEVIALVQQAYATGDFNGVKDLFETENERGCPLD